MNNSVKRIFPILLVIVILLSIAWYLFIYDRDFTRDMLLDGARWMENQGYHTVAAWLYDQAYIQSDNDASVAIELAQQFKLHGNYTKAELTLSRAIANGGDVELYIALCQTYVEQDKLLDAVTMLENVANPQIKEQLEALRPKDPTTSPAPGFYNEYISVNIECANGTLYVTTNGEYPSVNDTPYSEPIQLVGGENTICALVVGENGLVSRLVPFGYVVGGVIEPVTITDAALDAHIRQLLGKTADATLISNELWTITSLTMPAAATDYSDLKYLPYLTKLTIEGGSFDSLAPLASLPNLTELTIRDTVVGAMDVAVVGALPNLTRLTMENCSISTIANLTPASKLTYLNLNNNAIQDISVLSSLVTLEELYLSRNALTDLNAIGYLSSLKRLDVSYNALTDIIPLSNSSALQILDLSNNLLSNISGVEGMKGLTVLNLSYNDLTQIDLLAGNTALISLDISHNALTQLTALATLSQLQTLDFSYNEVTALPVWEKSCALSSITGSHNKLTSVANLGGLQNLNHVTLQYNKLTNVDALAQCQRLIKVDIFGNSVKDVSKLLAMSVIVNNNPI